MFRKLRYVIPRLRQAAAVRPAGRFLANELLLRPRGTRRYSVRASGLVLHVRHRSDDTGNVSEVLVDGAYDFPPAVEAALRDVTPLTVVDLGAYIGLFGLSVLAQRPDARITAVEPDHDNFALLTATIERNHATEHWSAIEACADTEPGQVRFTSGQGMGSRLSDDGTEVPGIDVLPLLEGADLIKIDVEGAEWKIISDPRFRSLRARALALEYHAPHDSARVVQALEAAGWRVLPFSERHPGYGDLWAVRG